MNYVELPPASPAEELERDEAAFCRADATGSESLRIWQPTTVAVVLGRGNQEQREASVGNCRADGVEILRRSSGGGAVLLMPGCLSYSFVMDRERRPELFSAPATNQYVMSALASLFCGLSGRSVAIRGDSDLVLQDRKIAGHAQRRGRRAILFHGCLLLDAELELIDRYLRHPSRSPGYRRGRGHADFVANAGWGADVVRKSLKEIDLGR